MSEPEDVILEGAHAATSAALRLWRRGVSARRGSDAVALADVKRRLELLIAAVFGVSPPIRVADPPAPPTWISRVAGRAPRHLVRRAALAATDGTVIRLPRALEAPDGAAAAEAVYRLLALEQAARVARGTAGWLATIGRGGAGPASCVSAPGAPASRLSSDPLLRDLFLLAEAAAVDGLLSRELPGIRAVLGRARAAALAERPPLDVLRGPEREVEAWVRAVLKEPVGAPAGSAGAGARGSMLALPVSAGGASGRAASDPAARVRPAPLPELDGPADSLRWARDARARIVTDGARYRGLPPVPHWGEVLPPSPARAVPGPDGEPPGAKPPRDRVARLERRPRVREAVEGEDDPGTGIWMVPIDDPEEKAEDPFGLQRPLDRDDHADPADLAESLAELPEARLVVMPGTPREILHGDDPPEARAHVLTGSERRRGLVYPEWDWRVRGYAGPGAVVHLRDSPAGDAGWVRDVLERRAGLVRAVRRRFERLRPRRTRNPRRPDGPEIDLAAYVEAFAGRIAGGPVDDRLYVEERAARRELATLLLVDVSASTDSWIGGRLRIIDVEKEALLLVCEALDALGDRYAILAFSGTGPEAVTVLNVKRFDEPNGDAVRRRVAGLEPDRHTRLGAALRHATAELARFDARHRLLLVLSDGKPNDVDVYEGRYGVEDARQAVVEARAQGVHTHCLTVDRQAAGYLPRIFGPSGYAVLRRAEALPHALVGVISRLVAGG